jgi:hypothetical protein
MKKIIYVFAMLLGSVSMAMDQDGAGIQESDVFTEPLAGSEETADQNINCLEIDQDEIDNCDALMVCEPGTGDAVEGSTFWTTCVVSPVKATVRAANEFASLAIRNPKLAFVMGVTYLAPVVAAAHQCCPCGCACRCYMQPGDLCPSAGISIRVVGNASGAFECMNMCDRLSPCKMYDSCK